MKNDEIQYGKPLNNEKNEPFIKEFYCAVCGEIPMEKDIKVRMGHLWQIPMERLMNGKVEQATLAVCSKCVSRIEAKMRGMMSNGVNGQIDDKNEPQGNFGGTVGV